MKNWLNYVGVTLGSIAVVATCSLLAFEPGCALSPVTTQGTNTVVNTNALIIDASVIQGIASAAATTIIAKDPSAKVYLQDYNTAVSGLINGATPSSAGQIVSLWSKSPNPTIAADIAPLVNAVSGFEQGLLAKYGPTVGGQIAIAILKAIGAGFAQAGIQ